MNATAFHGSPFGRRVVSSHRGLGPWPQFIVDDNVPKGIAYLIPADFNLMRAFKFDMRTARQRRAGKPQSDDMRQMLADLGIDR
jgi:hypothetical protein